MFHRWLTDDRDETLDRCIQCWTAAPNTAQNILGKSPVEADYGPVPLTCPGPDATNGVPTHTFRLGFPWARHYEFTEAITNRRMLHVYGGWTLVCEDCGYAPTETTEPSSFRWECQP